MSDRVFGFIWCVICLIAAFLPLRHHEDPRWGFAFAAILLAGAALFLPKILLPFNRAWTRFGAIMHVIISTIALFLIYYVVITPGGVLMRVLGRRSVAKDFDPSALSYWQTREDEPTDFTRPY